MILLLKLITIGSVEYITIAHLILVEQWDVDDVDAKSLSPSWNIQLNKYKCFIWLYIFSLLDSVSFGLHLQPARGDSEKEWSIVDLIDILSIKYSIFNRLLTLISILIYFLPAFHSWLVINYFLGRNFCWNDSMNG